MGTSPGNGKIFSTGTTLPSTGGWPHDTSRPGSTDCPDCSGQEYAGHREALEVRCGLQPAHRSVGCCRQPATGKRLSKRFEPLRTSLRLMPRRCSAGSIRRVTSAIGLDWRPFRSEHGPAHPQHHLKRNRKVHLAPEARYRSGLKGRWRPAAPARGGAGSERQYPVALKPPYSHVGCAQGFKTMITSIVILVSRETLLSQPPVGGDENQKRNLSQLIFRDTPLRFYVRDSKTIGCPQGRQKGNGGVGAGLLKEKGEIAEYSVLRLTTLLCVGPSRVNENICHANHHCEYTEPLDPRVVTLPQPMNQIGRSGAEYPREIDSR